MILNLLMPSGMVGGIFGRNGAYPGALGRSLVFPLHLRDFKRQMLCLKVALPLSDRAAESRVLLYEWVGGREGGEDRCWMRSKAESDGANAL